MQKGDKFDLEIIDNGMNFEGIAKKDDMIIFVPYAIKGEVVTVVIIKVNKNFAIGKILNLIKPSKARCDSICAVYKSCGGCDAHHISYRAQLEIKKNNIISLLKKQGLDYIKVNNVIGMGLPYYYRNKVQYPVRNVDRNR